MSFFIFTENFYQQINASGINTSFRACLHGGGGPEIG